MIKRTVEISREPAHLSLKHRQLVLKRDGDVVGQLPCEDLGCVVVDHPQTTYTHSVLAAMAESDAALIVCGSDHLPVGILLPLADHSQVVWRVNDQIAVKKPVRKRLWKQLIQAKIRGQANNLAVDSPARKKLLAYAADVRSGDPTNREAQAARLYWRNWLLQEDQDVTDEQFRRARDGVAPNALLNYGYAIVRAAIARSLVSSGLLPSLGLKHAHRANAFCLADDLIEPLRPLVDARVRELYWDGQTELDQPTKASLLELLAAPMITNDRQGPLMVALHTFTASLAKCYEGTAHELEIPEPCKSVGIAACG
ncbi:MAG: type II CRISPR-associated endonuclease Cas1 [Planctomycetaceae bacterium]|nr:type II CRISPR-associated endonuclease Cas1 [Planctomycetaceae bacterium]